MNEPLGDRDVLCISQFTLYGDARKGNRPSYVAAARPEHAEPLYERFCERLGAARGRFGAHMEVALVNDGPVTLLLELRSLQPAMPPVERFVCRFAAEPPQEGLPPAPGRRPCKPSSWPPACGSTPRARSSATPASCACSPTAAGTAARTCPVTAPTSHRPGALRLRLLRAPGHGTTRARTSRRWPTSRTRPPRAQPGVADRHLRGGPRQLARRGRPHGGHDARVGHAAGRRRPRRHRGARRPRGRPVRDRGRPLHAPRAGRLPRRLPRDQAVGRRRAGARLRVALRRRRRGRRARTTRPRLLSSGARSTGRVECAGSPSAGSSGQVERARSGPRRPAAAP